MALKDIVHECETEFGVFLVSEVIDISKSKFLGTSPITWYVKTVQTNCNEIF